MGSFDRLIVMGGPMGVDDVDAHPWLTPEKALLADVIAAGVGVLGICLGAQLIAGVLGAHVTPNPEKEIGWYETRRSASAADDPVLCRLPERFTPFHWHGDTFAIPRGAVSGVSSEACSNQVFSLGGGRVVGMQFHLETTHDAVVALVANCGEELSDPGRWVAGPEELVSDPARYAAANAVADDVLDAWVRASGSAPT